MIRGKTPEADLRRTYGKILWFCVGSSAVLNALIILLYPTSERAAYGAPEKAIIIQLEDIPETRQERRPPPPSRPVVPIATDDPDVADDVTIKETDIDLNDLLPPPELVEEDFLIEEEEEEIVEIWKVEKKPKLKTRPQPRYPEIARKAGIEARVFVTVLVGKDGRVEQVGEITGPEVFHGSVREAVKDVTFSPALQNDKPVRVWVSMPITFQLK